MRLFLNDFLPGSVIVSITNPVVMYAIYYRQKYVLFPWMVQIFLEIVGSLAFGSVCAYAYITCSRPWDVDDVECFGGSLLLNTVLSGIFAIFLVYVEILSILYYQYCVRTGKLDLFLDTAAKMAAPLVE